MEKRETEGAKLAEKADFEQILEGHWAVRITPNRKYFVTYRHSNCSCTCRDFTTHNIWCKHVWAVHKHVEKTGQQVDGKQPEPPADDGNPRERKYSQIWPKYNAAQMNERDQFIVLLHDLCKNQKSAPKLGRPKALISDVLFALVWKVYRRLSARRFNPDLKDMQAQGYISKVPSPSTLLAHLGDQFLSIPLRKMIELSALPLRALELDYAVDSTGFSAFRYLRWEDEKSGRIKVKRDWMKAHVMAGVDTKVVISVVVTDRKGDDAVQLPKLLEYAREFVIATISADSAYATTENLEAVIGRGAMPYIQFPADTTGGIGGLWEDMYFHFRLNAGAYMRKQRKQSNAETVFSMIKGKFGGYLFSKKNVTMMNEILCKILCHNLCCVIHGMYELGIRPNFNKEQKGQRLAP